MEKIILIGAGGHCKVAADIVKGKFDIAGVTDIDTYKHGKNYYGINVVGDDSILNQMYLDGVGYALVTFGCTCFSPIRGRIYSLAKQIGFKMANVISTNAVVSDSVTMGDGNVIMDGSIIHADTRLGSNVIINTGAVVEHDCVIEDHVHISPRAVVSGGATIGRNSHVGSGAIIIQGIKIGENCTIGAGTVVIKDIPDNSTAVGVPARIIK